MLNHNSIADETTPLEFNLSQNYPNPFKEKTTIKFCVPYKTRVQLNVYDSDNKLIEKLVDEMKDPGTYEVKFSASVCHSGEARNLPDGYYFFRLKTPDYLSKKKWFCINHLFGRLNMKALLQTLFFFLLTTQICFGQWYLQNSGTTQNLNKVQFVDANTGWAVGDSGTILYTTNSGVDWVQQTSGINLNLVDISFVDANTGWVLGRMDYSLSILLKTTNGGISWSQQIHDSLYFNAVFFIDENIGWLCSDGIILKTTDGGNIWIPKTLPPGEDAIRDIQFLDTYTGFAVGYYFTILKTTDGGDNWILQMGHFLIGGFTRLSFSDSENGFVLGFGGGLTGSLLKRTTNGGANWLTIDIPFYYCNDIYLINSNIVYAVGFQIHKSSDGGTTWDEQFSWVGKTLNGVHFLDENIGWVVGDSGTILHTTNGGVSIIDNEPTQPTEFILEQNYPNPFNPSTVISYQLPVSGDVTLKVYDILGNEIATLVDEYKSAGRYEIEFNAASLTSGVYFYQLRAVDPSTGSGQVYVNTKKMILIK